jgi:branched-chain amino acid transport system substrate-binding protein
MDFKQCVSSFCLTAILISSVFAATETPSSQSIKIGLSAPFSGPAAGLGLDFKRGIDAYLNQVNEQGGIANHKVELLSLDDGYEPSRTSVNLLRLIDQDKVLAILGGVGTTSAYVALPIINAKKILLFAPLTGSQILRKPPTNRYVINFRAGYAAELASIIKNLLANGIKPEEIAFFTQDDVVSQLDYQEGLLALKNAVMHTLKS